MHSPPSGPETPKESLVVRPQKPMGVNHNLNPTPQDPLREKEINMMPSTVRLSRATGGQELLRPHRS